MLMVLGLSRKDSLKVLVGLLVIFALILLYYPGLVTNTFSPVDGWFSRTSHEKMLDALDRYRELTLVHGIPAPFTQPASFYKWKIQKGEGSPKVYYQYIRNLILEGHEADALVLAQRVENKSSENAFLSEEAIRPFRHLKGLARFYHWPCLAQNQLRSCIFPLQQGNEHTRRARSIFGELVKNNYRTKSSSWMLSLLDQIHHTPAGGHSGFRSGTDIIGRRFTHRSVQKNIATESFYGGSVVEDFDEDGEKEIVSASVSFDTPIRYFDRTGDGGFEEATKSANFEGLIGGFNLVPTDFNNDGLIDLFVARGGGLKRQGVPNSLLKNRGNGRFEDVTFDVDLFSLDTTMAAEWGDYNNDGDLDLVVGNSTESSNGSSLQLYRNVSGDSFKNVTKMIEPTVTGTVADVSWGDVNNDGYLDLFLARAEDSNKLFLNEGDTNGRWSFREISDTAGIDDHIHSSVSWFWDYNNDGRRDLFVGSFDRADTFAEVTDDPSTIQGCVVYENVGGSRFEPRDRLNNCNYVIGGNYADLTLDGFPEVYVGRGGVELEALLPDRFYVSREGSHFEDQTARTLTGNIKHGNGPSFGDYDGDGDPDVYQVMGGGVLAHQGKNVFLENKNPESRNRLVLTLRGTTSNRLALGARLKLILRETTGGTRTIHTTVSTGGSKGNRSVETVVGLGKATSIEELEVTWPNKERTSQKFESVEINQKVLITEGRDKLKTVNSFEPAVERKSGR